MARDLRKYAQQTSVRLTVGFLFLVFLVGDGLIFAFYGRNAALMGLLCLLAVLMPAVIVIGSLYLIDRFVKYANRDEKIE